MSLEMEPLYDKEITCLLCEEKYITKRIRSRFIRMEKIDTDFYTEYKDPDCNPYFYEVHVCQHCGFAASDHFSTSFPPGAKEKIFQQICTQWVPRDFGKKRIIEEAIETYKLGIVSGTLKQEKHIVLAGLCIRLAWLYRMKGEEDQEKRFLRMTIKQYEGAFEHADYEGTQMSEMRLLYLLGELNRRVENEEEAVRFLSRVINHKNRYNETKTVEMARESWYKMRHEQDELT